MVMLLLKNIRKLSCKGRKQSGGSILNLRISEYIRRYIIFSGHDDNLCKLRL